MFNEQGYHGPMLGPARSSKLVELMEPGGPLGYMLYAILVGGWATPLKNMKVNWDDYSQYMGK